MYISTIFDSIPHSTISYISGNKRNKKKSRLYLYTLALLLFFPVYNIDAWPSIDTPLPSGSSVCHWSVRPGFYPMSCRTKNFTWYLYLTLSIIRYVSRVKWSNPGKGVAPFSTPRCSSYLKGTLLVALDNGCRLLHQCNLCFSKLFSGTVFSGLFFFIIFDSLWSK